MSGRQRPLRRRRRPMHPEVPASAATRSARAAGPAGSRSCAHDPATGPLDLLTDQDRPSRWPSASSTEQPQSPSYLAWHPDGRHLYAVGEVSDGRVWALEIDGPRRARPARYSDRRPPAATHPCHLAVDPSGRVLRDRQLHLGQLGRASVAAGRSARRADRSWCSTRDPARTPIGSGVRTRTWSTFVDETLVLAVDLGADLIAAYRLDAAAATLAPLASSVAAGRVRAAAPGRARPRPVVVVGELTGEIALLRLDPATGRLELLDLQRGSDGTGEPAAPSGIGRTADGRYVLMANRGPDTVASFRVHRADHRSWSTRSPAAETIRGTSRWSTTGCTWPTRRAARSPCCASTRTPATWPPPRAGSARPARPRCWRCRAAATGR